MTILDVDQEPAIVECEPGRVLVTHRSEQSPTTCREYTSELATELGLALLEAAQRSKRMHHDHI